MNEHQTALVQLRDARRKEAVEYGCAIEKAKADGKKMRDIRFLENQHRDAWSRFYAIDCLIDRSVS